eukprot:SAG22_NODE_78_length_22065_cov_7.473095_17_plen_365_part_00
MLRLVTLAGLAALASGCNTDAELAADIAGTAPFGSSQSHGGAGGLDRVLESSAPLTLLPQDKGNESPACLDGSPYGFYFNPSKTGSTKWTISIEGGGWVGSFAPSTHTHTNTQSRAHRSRPHPRVPPLTPQPPVLPSRPLALTFLRTPPSPVLLARPRPHPPKSISSSPVCSLFRLPPGRAHTQCYDEQDCYGRSKMALGSSKGWAKTAGCGCMNTVGDGIDEDCNCIYMPYGDGASFSGYRPDPWPVPGSNGETLTFRGIKNIDGVIDWAMKNGLTKATEFVLTGGSAGGLSTFLHADRVAGRLEAEAPDCKLIRAAPVVGYFLDHGNFKHTTGEPNTPTWHQANYTTWMRYIYKMQNLTFGE